MGRRSLTLLMLALFAFGGLGWLLSRGSGSEGSEAADLPDTEVVDTTPDREVLMAAPEAVTPEPEREAPAAEAPEAPAVSRARSTPVWSKRGSSWTATSIPSRASGNSSREAPATR